MPASRAAVITGLRPDQTGIYELGHSMVNSAAAMASVGLEEQFKRHGYDTYLTGKFYHTEPTKRAWPEERMKAAWTEIKEPVAQKDPQLAGGYNSIGHAPGGMESMNDVAALKNTKGWLAAKHDKPFFIVQGLTKPHVALVVPKEFFDMYPL
ncbi:MAG: sulfatase-like hydrolase/transferase, partial [Verrucomicrobiae bacterium]|nr:sulfatase-like hydrolase/transferase [Verrucomicrobiae bacterium]